MGRRPLQIFWDVHAMAGVLAGLVLHVMFFAGVFSLFYDDLTVFQEPWPNAAGAPKPVAELIAPVIREHHLEGKTIDVALPVPRRPAIHMHYHREDGTESPEMRIDTRSGVVTPVRSHLAGTMVQLHYLYHERFPSGIYIAGLFGGALLLALVTGLLIHLRDLVRELHQFRPFHKPRVLWADAHKVLGVFGLPFQIIIGFTGTMLCLGPLFLAAFVKPVFGGDKGAAERALYGGATVPAASKNMAAPLALDEILARGARAVPGLAPNYVHISNYGDAEGTAELYGSAPGALFGRARILVRMRDGEVLGVSAPATEKAGQALSRYIYGLHLVYFGGMGIKIIYAILGLCGCVTILSGNWLWIRKRWALPVDRVGRVLERLTVASGAGACFGTAMFFCANRLIPHAVTTREDWESVAFFGTWALCFVWCALRKSALQSWVDLLLASGVLFAMMPFLTTITWGLRAVGFIDGALVVLGAALLGGGALLRARMAAADAPKPAVAAVEGAS
ncbi:putative iron-regulated membrane protein [Minicystis rosea]|nr:putative iron-regulated membrane protein [Minicystis rosea]